MPGVNALQDKCTKVTSRSHSPEDIPLQLNGGAACPCMLEVIKFQLREGQAHDTLNDLQQGLRSSAYILRFKDHFLRGQGANTQVHNCLETLDAKVDAAATRYCVAYQSLSALSASVGLIKW